MSTTSQTQSPRTKHEIITITPADAQEFIDNAEVTNRRIRAAKVREYADLMVAGKWDADVALIQVDKGLRLLNGFHRMRAVVRAGVPVSFTIAYDVDPKSLIYMDTGIKRTTEDTMRMVEGGKYQDIPAGGLHAAKILDMVETRGLDHVWSATKRGMTQEEQLALLEKYEERHSGWLSTAFSEGRDIAKECGTKPAASSAFWYMLKDSGADRRMCSEFIAHLKEPASYTNTRRTTPVAITALRRAMKDSTVENKPRAHLGILITAWNVHVTGGAASEVWFEYTDPLPEIVTNADTHAA